MERYALFMPMNGPVIFTSEEAPLIPIDEVSMAFKASRRNELPFMVLNQLDNHLSLINE